MTEFNKSTEPEEDFPFRDAEEIFAVDDIKFEVISVPEWKTRIRLKTMTGLERDKWENSFRETRNGKTKENLTNFRARMVAAVAVDQNGNKMFGTDRAVLRLGTKSVKGLQRVFNKAQEMNGLSDKDVEEMTEDFDQTPDESSLSD